MFISSVFGFHATLDSRIAPVPGDIDRVREWPWASIMAALAWRVMPSCRPAMAKSSSVGRKNSENASSASWW